MFSERKYLILRSKREAVERELGVQRWEQNDSVAFAEDLPAVEAAVYGSDTPSAGDEPYSTTDDGEGFGVE